jgi:Calcineurin-like phosphoesterase
MFDALDSQDGDDRNPRQTLRRRSALQDRLLIGLASLVLLGSVLPARGEHQWQSLSVGPMASPGIEDSVVADGRRALEAWGHFAVTNDLTWVRPWFWAEGPQFRQLIREAHLRAEQPPLGPPSYRFTLSLRQVLAPLPDYRVLTGQVRLSRADEAAQVHNWDIWMRHDPSGAGGRWRVWTVSRSVPGSALAHSPSDPVVAAAGDISPVKPDGGAKATSNIVLSVRPTAVLTLGDLQYPSGSLAHFRRLYHPTWGRLRAKTRPAVGNHEYETPDAAGYFEYFGKAARPAGKSYYSFDLGGWHLISLDSQIDRHPGSAQERWLRADLMSTAKRCILAYWHFPRFTSGGHQGDNLTVAPFWNALYLARADIVLSGHEHSYERFALQSPSGRASQQGIRQFVVGTGGAGLLPFGPPKQNSQVRRNDTWGVLILTLHPDSYRWQFIAVDGKVRDRGGPVSCH